MSDSFYVGFASIKSFDINHFTFSIYPNPSDGKVTIEVPKKGVYEIEVFTIGGQLVRLSDSPTGELYRSLNKRIELNLNLAPGPYIITLTDENGNVGSKPITINR